MNIMSPFNGTDFKPVEQFYTRVKPSLVNSGTVEAPVWEIVRLGFMTPDGTDSAAAKRKRTVDQWGKVSPIENHFRYGTMPEFPAGLVDEWRALERGNLFSVPNDPLEGFELSRSVRRYGWNGGNVVWRMTHPHGFEFEITSANMAAIAVEGAIVNGVVQGKCFFVRSNQGINVLVPEGTALAEKFKRDVEKREKIEVKKKAALKLTDLTPGDIIESLPNSPVNGAVYLGVFDVELQNVADQDLKSEKYTIRGEHLFAFLSQGRLFSMVRVKKPTILGVSGKFEGDVDPNAVRFNAFDWSYHRTNKDIPASWYVLRSEDYSVDILTARRENYYYGRGTGTTRGLKTIVNYKRVEESK